VNTPAPLDAKLAEERVLGWQTKLHRWAVGDEQQRFGDLFNLVCDPATLLVAWERVKRNRGSRTAGVDGPTRKQVEQLGVDGVLAELRQELKDGTYRPLPARERLIPKRSGKLRSLGISALRDRIVQTAAKLSSARADLRGGLLPDLVRIQARAPSPGRDRTGAVLHPRPSLV
jgi:RNA-directed DNA polymerase